MRSLVAVPARVAPTVLLGAGVIALSLNPLYGFVALAIGAALVLILAPPSALTVTVTTTLLVLLPDSPDLFHVSHLQITPRILALALILLQWTIAVFRAQVPMRLTFAKAWSVYAVVVVVGALLVNRPQAVPLFLALALMPYCVGCTLGADAALLRAVLRGIVVGSCILGAVAIIEFIRHKALFSPVYNRIEYARAGNLRANAGWQHPLALGMFLCLGAFVTIEEARQRSSALAAGAALLIAGGIFATQERSPVIGLVVGALVFVLLQLNTKMRGRALLLAGITVLAVFATPGSSGTAFREFFGQSTSVGTTASADVVGRFELFRLGSRAIAARPLVGFGYGTGANVQGSALLTPFLMSAKATYTDIANWPLTIAIETGLIGLAAFAFIVGGGLVRLVRRRSIIAPLPVVPAIAGVVAALVTSFGVASLPSSLLFLFVMGVYSTGCETTDAKP